MQQPDPERAEAGLGSTVVADGGDGGGAGAAAAAGGASVMGSGGRLKFEHQGQSAQAARVSVYVCAVCVIRWLVRGTYDRHMFVPASSQPAHTPGHTQAGPSTSGSKRWRT